MNEPGSSRSHLSNGESKRSQANRATFTKTKLSAEGKAKPSPVSYPENKVELAAKPRAVYLLPEQSQRLAFGAKEEALLAELMEFVVPPLRADSWHHHKALIENVEAIFTGWDSPKLDGTLLAAFPALRVVFHTGGSVKFLVTDDFWNRGIRLTCAASENAVPVAEYTFAQIVLALKNVWPSAYATRKTRRFLRSAETAPSAYGSTVGIISFGHVGREVAVRLRALEVKVIGYDPLLSPLEAKALGVKLCSLEDVFILSDVVTCHTPLLPETRHLLRERHFALMKPNATFINTARGAIVHETELVSVLMRRPEIFAVLDVTDPEPPLKNSLLFTLPNVLLTPHISGSIGPECRRMSRMIAEEARRYVTGKPLLGEIKREKLDSLA